MNPPSFNMAEDLSEHYHLSSFTILNTLKSRYQKGEIYVREKI